MLLQFAVSQEENELNKKINTIRVETHVCMYTFWYDVITVPLYIIHCRYLVCTVYIESWVLYLVQAKACSLFDLTKRKLTRFVFGFTNNFVRIESKFWVVTFLLKVRMGLVRLPCF